MTSLPPITVEEIAAIRAYFATHRVFVYRDGGRFGEPRSALIVGEPHPALR